MYLANKIRNWDTSICPNIVLIRAGFVYTCHLHLCLVWYLPPFPLPVIHLVMMTEEVQMMGPLVLKEETVELVPLQEEELVAMAAGHLEVLQLPKAVELGLRYM